MAAPLITVGSYQAINTGTGTTGTLNVPVSASGNDRLVLVTFTAKDNASPAAVPNLVNFDPTGVNLNIGTGVTEQGARQLAIESTFSSQCSLWMIKEADLPSSAGTYAIDVGADLGPQYGFWEAWEVTGASQLIDAITEISDTADVSAGVDFSSSVTTLAVDSLVIDIWSTSHSSAPTYSVNQNQLGTQSQTNGGTVISWINKAVVGSQVMTENSSTFHQRRAGKVISIAPVSGVAPLDVNLNVTAGDSLVSANIGIEEDVSVSVVAQDSTVSISVSEDQAVTVSVVLEDSISSSQVTQVNDASLTQTLADSIVSIIASEVQAIVLELVLGDSITSAQSGTEQKVNLGVILDDSVSSIQSSTNQDVNLIQSLEDSIVAMQASGTLVSNVNLDLVLGDSTTSIISDIEIDLNLNKVLDDSVSNIIVSQSSSVVVGLQLEGSTTAIQAEQINNANIAIQAQDSVTNIVATVDSSGTVVLDTTLGDSIVAMLTGTEQKLNLSVQIEDSNVLISVSGVILSGGSFTKVIEGHSVFTKTIEGHDVFIKEVLA